MMNYTAVVAGLDDQCLTVGAARLDGDEIAFEGDIGDFDGRRLAPVAASLENLEFSGLR